jgi:hypothetical protein
MYLACADPANKTQDQLYATWNKRATLKSLSALRSVTKQLADLQGTFLACVRAIPWTPAFESDVHDLLKAFSAVQVLYLDLAASKTFSIFNYYNAKLTAETASTAAANQLRGDLGLPPPPVS